jgi:type I restriction enzyme M protein
MATFEDFQRDFLLFFTSDNFYENKTYLEYISDPQTNDEDNIVDTKIIIPLLTALGFESGDIAKNITNQGKDKRRPDFQVRLSQSQNSLFFWLRIKIQLTI